MPAKKKHKAAEAPLPWEEGNKEMNRMFGDLAFRRRQWMLAALISMTTSIVLAIGMVALVLSDRNVPWIVEVDKLGDIRVAGEVASLEVPETVRVAALYRLVRSMRQIPGDARILEAQHRTAQAHLANDARMDFIRDLQDNSEELSQMLAERQLRYVTGISSVLPFPGQPGLYRVTWTEEYTGRRTDEVSYEGYFQVQPGANPTPEMAILNPLGIFITEYSISRNTPTP